MIKLKRSKRKTTANLLKNDIIQFAKNYKCTYNDEVYSNKLNLYKVFSIGCISDNEVNNIKEIKADDFLINLNKYLK